MNSEIDSYLASTAAQKQSDFLDSTQLKAGDEIDGFTAVALIGRGASCEVWRVHDHNKKRDVALKLFTPLAQQKHKSADADNSIFRKRFITESNLLATLNHPNIIKFYQAGTFCGEPYFTLELLRPIPEQMSKRQIAKLGIDMCRALNYLHSQKIIHRDIKPANILLASDGHFVLADLGIMSAGDRLFAKFLGNNGLTIAEGCDHALGTPGYAAPEQLCGKKVNPSADIHALGVLFSNLLGKNSSILWRMFIRHMTSTLPGLRFTNFYGIRLALTIIRYSLHIKLAVLCAILGIFSIFAIKSFEPHYSPLQDEYISKTYEKSAEGGNILKYVFKLPSKGNYTRGDLIYPPTQYYDSQTNEATYYRQRLTIIGPGTFYAPVLSGAEVYLISNVVLRITHEQPIKRLKNVYYKEVPDKYIEPIIHADVTCKIEYLD